MKTAYIQQQLQIVFFISCLAIFTPLNMEAQRLNHRVSRGGGGSIHRTTPTRTPNMSRPTTTRPTTSRPTTSRPKTSINGGFNKSTSRDLPKRNNTSTSRVRPSTNPGANNKSINRNVTTNRNVNTNRSTNRQTSNIRNKAGNKVNIDKGHNNINVNIDNSKHFNVNNHNNTRVRSSHRHYSRPPYIYGGHHYYCHRPYYYHPYRPFYWGPVWHPWGFFVASIATTAIIVSIENQRYHYDNGVYYIQENGGYTVVQAPIGATVQTIPKEAEVVKVSETTNNYYYGGAYYEKDANGYTVVPATAGTIVPHLPEGGEEIKIGDQTYVQFGDTYYQPIQVDGKDMYEIVEVKDE